MTFWCMLQILGAGAGIGGAWCDIHWLPPQAISIWYPFSTFCFSHIPSFVSSFLYAILFLPWSPLHRLLCGVGTIGWGGLWIEVVMEKSTSIFCQNICWISWNSERGSHCLIPFCEACNFGDILTPFQSYNPVNAFLGVSSGKYSGDLFLNMHRLAP